MPLLSRPTALQLGSHFCELSSRYHFAPKAATPVSIGVPHGRTPRRKLPLRLQVRMQFAIGTITLLLEKME
jgi:hypothetical protein